MIALVLATFFSASFSLVVRHAQRRGRNLWAAGAINYAVASLFHLARHLQVGGPLAGSRSTLIIGLLGGLAYVGSYFILFPAMSLRGVSITTAVLRLAVVVPIAVSILLWGERPVAMQAFGATLAMLSLPLLTIRPSTPGQHLDRRGLWLLIALFIGDGCCMLSIRGFQQTGLVEETSLFLGVLFGTAGLVAAVGWWLHREGTTRRDILPGLALGLCNALANYALVMALTQLPSVVVFPFQSAVGLVYVALFARLAWRERIGRLETAGMGLALLAVTLVNLG